MTDLQVRRVRFDFSGDDVPFNWQPERPALAMVCNLMTFVAPAFEKFVVHATREAIPLMRNPKDAEEADAYLRQEAQHSAAHQSHLRALIRRWPGLAEIDNAVVASYDHLTATKPLAWRLAYTAVVEATFTPYFGTFLEHEDKLFATGDERVASLFLWHFVEEIEHRSSALLVYDAVHGSFPYRVRVIPDVIKHITSLLKIVADGFVKHVPAEDGGEYGRLIPTGLSPRAILGVSRASRRLLQSHQKPIYADVPRRDMNNMLLGLVRSQAPSHDPATHHVPEFADRWANRYNEDSKVAARWYSLGVGQR